MTGFVVQRHKYTNYFQQSCTLLYMVLVRGWTIGGEEFRVGSRATDPFYEVFVAVTQAGSRREPGISYLPRQIQQVLQSTHVTRAILLGRVNRGEFWDGDQLLLRDGAENTQNQRAQCFQ